MRNAIEDRFGSDALRAQVRSGSELSEVLARTSACLDRLEFDTAARRRTLMAMEELTINALMHAEPPDGVFLITSVARERVRLRLVYRGPEFDPSDVSLPGPARPEALGGQGLRLAQAAADTLLYRRRGVINEVDVSVSPRA